jgi:glutathione S-transferase
MKLHEHEGLPSPRRVRIFLAEKGIEGVERIQVDVAAGAARGEAFLAKNPLGEVPVLELDDGSSISEVAAISRYFEAAQPEPPLFGTTAAEQATIEMWLRRIETGLMGGAAAYFHHATTGFGALETYQNKSWGEKSRDRALASLRLLDSQLAGRDFIAGESFSVADIAALCALDFAQAIDIEVPSELVRLHAWHERVSRRPSAAA